MDSGAFWKKVNNRRMASHTSAGSEIKFRDKVCRDPAEIAAGWGQYFCELYSDLDRAHYDSNFQSYVERKVNSIFEELSSCEEGDVVYISAEEVRKSVKCLKTKKACGHDKVYNEHLINGGPALYEQLAVFYTEMYNYGYIPSALKEGIL